jgi:hypothetical protein
MGLHGLFTGIALPFLNNLYEVLSKNIDAIPKHANFNYETLICSSVPYFLIVLFPHFWNGENSDNVFET